MRIDVIQPADLGVAEIARWREIQDQHPSLSSPFFTPEYMLSLGSARPDLRIAVLEDQSEIVGFFAGQRPLGSAGMPAGTPISDYQGLIAAPDLSLNLADMCRSLRMGRLDFSQVPDDQAAFASHARATTPGWLADVSVGSTAYFTGVRERHRNFLYQLGRTRRKLVRERGDVVFTANSQNSAHFEQLLQWKEMQLQETRQPLVWRRSWVRKALLNSRETSNQHFGGALFTLTLGERLIAANFCFHGRQVLHGVLMSHDREFEAFSPGLQLLRHILEWAADRGFQSVEFGSGAQLYKRQFGSYQRSTIAGWVGTSSLASVSRAAQYAVRHQIEKIPHRWIAALPGRAMRRLDVYRGLNAPAPQRTRAPERVSPQC